MGSREKSSETIGVTLEVLRNDWICTATRIYKPDGFNPFCHDYVHIVYTPTALFALCMYILCICHHDK